MLRLFVMMFRLMPALVILGIITFAIYKAYKSFRGDTLAKEIAIKVTFWISTIIVVASLLITLYAIADNSWIVTDLSLALAILFLVPLIISIICRHNFLKKRPHYPWVKSKLWKKILKIDVE